MGGSSGSAQCHCCPQATARGPTACGSSTQSKRTGCGCLRPHTANKQSVMQRHKSYGCWSKRVDSGKAAALCWLIGVLPSQLVQEMRTHKDTHHQQPALHKHTAAASSPAIPAGPLLPTAAAGALQRRRSSVCCCTHTARTLSGCGASAAPRAGACLLPSACRSLLPLPAALRPCPCS